MSHRSWSMTPEDYWNQDDMRKDQKFYVSFCMLESALADHGIATDLCFHHRLNWATTAYYYSLVHSMRLLCFLALGDFPKGHFDLAKVYKDGHCADSAKKWLSEFVGASGSSLGISPIAFRREDITRKFVTAAQAFAELDGSLKKWGSILDVARECRDDSNYEGLIIAHQHAHQRVTKDFEELTVSLRKASASILKETARLFKMSVDTCSRKAHHYSYLNWRQMGEGLLYFEEYLKSRFLREEVTTSAGDLCEHSETADSRVGRKIFCTILEWLNPLREKDIDVAKAEQVWQNIRLGVFNEKGSLMAKFRRHVQGLKAEL